MRLKITDPALCDQPVLRGDEGVLAVDVLQEHQHVTENIKHQSINS